MDRQSDDSSRRADSDSHPENWTDHEANDPPNYLAGSPPKSEQPNKSESSERKTRLFARDRGTPGSNKSKKHSLSVDLKPSSDLNNTEVRLRFRAFCANVSTERLKAIYFLITFINFSRGKL